MTGKIFINYRRGDDPGHTGRLFDRLQESFQPEQLFMDVDSIAPGFDFVRVLEEQVEQCDVLLAIIGRGWVDAVDQDGRRRLENPQDFVRIEIEVGLKLGKRVIPILVNDAEMPRAEQLPEALAPLARRHAVRLTHDRFKADTQGLIKSLEIALAEAEAARKAVADALAQAERQRKLDDAKRKEEAERAEQERARQARDDQYRAAMTGSDAAAMVEFLKAYPIGRQADDVRLRLRSIEPKPAWRPSLLLVLLGGCVLGAGAFGIWFLTGTPVPPPDQTTSGPTVTVTSGPTGLGIYRAEFFGQLAATYGKRPDIRTVGDRFVFQSDAFFDPGKAELKAEGTALLGQLVPFVLDLEKKIPPEYAWTLRIDSHTDARPLIGSQFKSNRDLSSARANAVLQYLMTRGVSPQRLVPAGFGEFQPLDADANEDAYRRNRRIELKLVER